jgi:hypothetical protein
MEIKPKKAMVDETLGSLGRVAGYRKEVAASLDSKAARGRVKDVVKPSSPASTMKKVGVALIAAPDPITAVPGVALLASAYALKKKEPASLNSLLAESRKILRDLQSLSL